MKKRPIIAMLSVCAILLGACSKPVPAEETGKWDCSVVCAEESVDTYVITYSNEKIISKDGVLSFQNQNDFDIVVHLLADGEEEIILEIPAGGTEVLYQVKKEIAYTVGCHAEVEENTEIKLMVYDGEGAEIY